MYRHPGLLNLPMQQHRFLGIFLFSFLFNLSAFGQDQDSDFSISEVKMIVRDIVQTGKWYVKNLNFEVKKAKSREFVILTNGDFTLHMVTHKRTILPYQVQLPPNKERINGFYELGFTSSDLDSLMYQFEGRGIRYAKDYGFDPDYNTETVTLIDPDGNRVKLFQEHKERNSGFHYFRPEFVSITTSDIETGSRWYVEKMGFTEIRNNYSQHARISYSILKKGSVTVELQELSGRTMETTELLSDQVELTRFDQITFAPSHSAEPQPLTDNDGNKLRN